MVDNTRERGSTVLRNRFFKWGSLSLVGHLALFELTCGMPLFLFSVATMYSERTLTMASSLYMAFVCSSLVAVGAALFWYTFSKARLEGLGPK